MSTVTQTPHFRSSRDHFIFIIFICRLGTGLGLGEIVGLNVGDRGSQLAVVSPRSPRDCGASRG